MAIDSKDLQGAIDEVNKHSTVIGSWSQKLFSMFYSPTPANVEVDGLDNNGNIITVNVPNKAQIEAEFETWKANTKSGYPFLNLLRNPYFNIAGASTWGMYNPNAHIVATSVVAWDYNTTTIEIMRQLSMLDVNNIPKFGSVLETYNLQLFKVNITRNINTANYIQLSGFFGAYETFPQSFQGQFTAIIGAVGCSLGTVKIDGHTSTNLTVGEVKKSLTAPCIMNGWSHLDVFNVYLESDTIELYFALPALVSGDAQGVAIENIQFALKEI